MDKKIRFILNNEEVETNLPPAYSTLKFLRNNQNLKGTKTGCGEGECGACTILVGNITGGIVRYRSVTSCIMPLGEMSGKHVVTIEGISKDELSPVQEALVDEGAIQCGFCTPGFVMSLTGFFLSGEKLSYRNILNSIDGNICRCTGYFPIKRAAKKLLDIVSEFSDSGERIKKIVELSFVPEYFLSIRERLEILNDRILSEKDTGDEKNRKMVFVGGGTDLLTGKADLSGDENLRFVSDMSGDINSIVKNSGFICIGAGVTVEDIKNSEVIREEIPEIEHFMEQVSSGIIRNMATLGGNIVNASPIGDLSIFFLAMDSLLVLAKTGVKREVKLKDFFLDYKIMDLGEGELIESLKFPVYDGDMFFNFEKVSRRKYLDIAGCNSAITISLEKNKIKKCLISAGGVAPIPLFLKKGSEFIVGKEITTQNIRELCEIVLAEISPISDVRGSAEYKKELLIRLIYSHFSVLFPDRINVGELI